MVVVVVVVVVSAASGRGDGWSLAWVPSRWGAGRSARSAGNRGLCHSDFASVKTIRLQRKGIETRATPAS